MTKSQSKDKQVNKKDSHHAIIQPKPVPGKAIDSNKEIKLQQLLINGALGATSDEELI